MTQVFSLAHLTDTHICSHHVIKLREFLSKRMYAFLSWHLGRRSRKQSLQVLDLLTRDLRCSQTDHVAVTGDLIHMSLPDEYHRAKQWLAGLAADSSQVTAVPGNHDLYVKNLGENALWPWSRYMLSDADIDPFGKIRFPLLRVRPPMALIGLNTACFSPPGFAYGFLGKDQLLGLRDVLTRLQDSGLFKVLLLHHPPYSGLASFRKRLLDQKGLGLVLAKQPVDLIIHGHYHSFSVAWLPGFDRTPVVGAPAASSIEGHPERVAGYNIYSLRGKAGTGWSLDVQVRRYSFQDKVFLTDDYIQLLP